MKEKMDELLKAKDELAREGQTGAKNATRLYIGTKIVRGSRLSDAQFAAMKGKEFPKDQEAQAGYLVEYEDGYQSWSPADVFERCYRLVTGKEAAMMVR